MKKTLNINLAGYPFTIDEDAYNLLKDYLDTIRYAFETSEDTGELATDIEGRIAEILIEKEGGMTRIVTLDEISKVIERIGKPSDFIEVEKEVNINENHEDEIMEEKTLKEEKITPPPYNVNSHSYSRNPFVRKNLFRDPQNAMLGGVCSGLAAYLHIDVTIVRLLTVLLFFLSATTVAIVYIVMWIVVPEANTPLQRMKMMGENPTMENIGKTVTDNHRNEEDYPGSGKSEKGFLSSALSVFVKCLILLGLLIGLPLLIAIGAAILGCVIAIFVISIGIVGGGMFDSLNEGLMVLYILFAVIGGAIAIGVPLWLLIRMALKKKNTNLSPSNRKSLLIIWLAGIALVAVFTVKAVKKGKYIDREQWRYNIENLEQLNEMDGHEIEDIKINRGEITVISKDGTKYKISKGVVTKETEETSDTEIIENETLSETDSLTTTELVPDPIK